MSRQRPTGQQVGQLARQARDSVRAQSARDWANECGIQRRALRCLGRLSIVIGAHLLGSWFLANVGANLLGLLVGYLALFVMLSAFGAVVASKATGTFTSAVGGWFWANYLSLWAWGFGLKLRKEDKKKKKGGHGGH